MNRAKKVLTLSLANFSGSVAAIGIGFVLSRMLTKSDYASYNQVFMLYNVCAAIFLLGLPKALLYFIPRSENSTLARREWMSNLTLLFILGGVLALLMHTVLAEVLAMVFGKPELLGLMKTMSWYPILVFPAMALPTCLIAHNKEKEVAIYSITTKVSIFVVVSLVAIYAGELDSILWARIIIAIVFLGFAVYLMAKAFEFKYERPNWSVAKGQLSYSIPLCVGGALAILNLSIDKFIVGHLAGDEVFALYTNGAIEIPLLGMLAGQIGTVLMPDLAKAAKNGHLNSVHRVWARSANIVAFIVFPITIFMWVFAEEIMILLFSEKYVGSAPFFRIYSLLLPLRIVQFGVIFSSMNKGKLVIIRSLIALLLNGLISYPMVVLFGAQAAAWTTVLIVIVFTVPYCMYWTSKWMRVSWVKLLDYSFLIKSMGVAIFCVIISGFLFKNTMNPLLSVSCSICLVLFLYLSICLLLGQIRSEVVNFYKKIGGCL